MDRERIAALAAAALIVGGAWWWYRKSLQLAGAPDPLAAADDASSSAGLLDSIAQLVPDAVQNAAESVVSAITPGPWAPPARADAYLPAIYAAEDANGIPRNLLARLLYQESHFRPEIIDGTKASPVGALGIAQFMPATAAALGVDPLNPDDAIAGAARYLRSLYDQTGTWSLALAAYNWGIGNVKRKGIAAAPLETRNYVAQITGDVGVA